MTQQQKPRGYFLDRDWIANEISSSQVQYLAQLENIQSKRREELNQLLHKANTQPDLLEACKKAALYLQHPLQSKLYPEQVLELLTAAIEKGGGK